MSSLKVFRPGEIDETLTRVVAFGGHTHLLFPYIDATGASPQFSSIGCIIEGGAATTADFASLSALVSKHGAGAVWFISFNTPWLLPVAEAAKVEQRRRAHRQ
jgi:hypothetical protein